MNFREIERIILSDGWYLDDSTGSHRQYKHPTKKGKVTIPFHGSGKDIDIRVAKSIFRQAQIEVKK